VSFFLVGDESLNWHSLIADFILVGQRLEKLGFTGHGESVIIANKREKSPA
jgi:hypothetical protein